jgi:hypothetical protein
VKFYGIEIVSEECRNRDCEVETDTVEGKQLFDLLYFETTTGCKTSYMFKLLPKESNLRPVF